MWVPSFYGLPWLHFTKVDPQWWTKGSPSWPETVCYIIWSYCRIRNSGWTLGRSPPTSGTLQGQVTQGTGAGEVTWNKENFPVCFLNLGNILRLENNLNNLNNQWIQLIDVNNQYLSYHRKNCDNSIGKKQPKKEAIGKRYNLLLKIVYR